MLASWITNRIRPRYLSSVAGGFRWGWLLRCLMITVPLFVIYLVLQFLIGWDYQPKPRQWVALLIIVVIGIPFQSAGEEYAFRGLVLQNVGSWFANRKVALVVSIIPSVLLFALAHGSFDPWVFADLAIFAISSCILAWRTGGLEASVALHATNNVTLMIATILFGGWADAFISQGTKGDPLMPLATLVVNGLSVTLILWMALQRIYRPT
jgi:membrane protease YdiL (CAAX protease family)